MAVAAHIAPLLREAQVATFGERPLPLPAELRAKLSAAAEAANDAAYEDCLGASIEEDLLMHAAFAACAHPYQPEAYAALRAAVALIASLHKAEAEEAKARAHAETSWERKAGIMG